MTQQHDDFERVQIEFLRDWQAGKSPTLQDYLGRFPQFGPELCDFVLHWVPQQNELARQQPGTETSASTLSLIDEAMQRVSAPTQNVTEARQAMGWSLSRLAREMNLPPALARQMARGFRSWPAQLEEKLAHALCRTQEQARAILQNTSPLPATQFKATGQPASANLPTPSWDEALAECAGRGELSPEQEREWLG